MYVYCISHVCERAHISDHRVIYGDGKPMPKAKPQIL